MHRHAGDAGLDDVLSRQLASIFDKEIKAGFGDEDVTALLKALRSWPGRISVSLRGAVLPRDLLSFDIADKRPRPLARFPHHILTGGHPVFILDRAVAVERIAAPATILDQVFGGMRDLIDHNLLGALRANLTIQKSRATTVEPPPMKPLRQNLP